MLPPPPDPPAVLPPPFQLEPPPPPTALTEPNDELLPLPPGIVREPDPVPPPPTYTLYVVPGLTGVDAPALYPPAPPPPPIHKPPPPPPAITRYCTEYVVAAKVRHADKDPVYISNAPSVIFHRIAPIFGLVGRWLVVPLGSITAPVDLLPSTTLVVCNT